MPVRPLAPTAADVARVRAVLETHAAIARRWSQHVESAATPTPTPASTGVLADGTLEERDLRRLVILADESLLRRIFTRLTREEIAQLQSRLDDVQGDLFNGNEALASQNYLLQLYQDVQRVAPEPPRAPPRAPPPELTDEQHAEERAYDLFFRHGDAGPLMPPRPGIPPPPFPRALFAAWFAFESDHFGLRVAALDHASPERTRGVLVGHLFLGDDMNGVAELLEAYARRLLEQEEGGEEERAAAVERLRGDASAWTSLWLDRGNFWEELNAFLDLRRRTPAAERPAAFEQYTVRQAERAAEIQEATDQLGTRLAQFQVLLASATLRNEFLR